MSTRFIYDQYVTIFFFNTELNFNNKSEKCLWW